VKRIFGFVLLVCFAAGCQSSARETILPSPTAHLVRKPDPLPASQGALAALPRFDESNGDPFQIDLRGRDLSGLDLRDSQTELDNAVFDTATIWPAKDKLPGGFDPQRILELGKVPGPGLSALHAQGITGKGISIGIVDSTLLVDHQEYADRLRWYEEINTNADEPAFMHGPGVASIAAGKTVGVAPEASLYFIGQDVTEDVPGGLEAVDRGMAQGIRRLLEINATLPKEQKIRVISISLGMGPDSPGWDEISSALQAADEQGVFVIYIEMQMAGRGPVYNGLGREALSDPQDFASYQAGAFWAGYETLDPKSGWIFVPMDSRTLASPTGSDQYAFYRLGGLSWGPPFLAGMYALAAQVDPAITPQRFWDLAQRTGKPVAFSNGKGVILDPVAFISAVRNPESFPTVTAASVVDPSAIVFPKIDRYPDSTWMPERKVYTEEPIYDPMSWSIMGLDLTNADLSGLDLSASLDNMLMAAFDTLTTWPGPEKLPPGYDPQKILEQGKTPGPGVRGLHAQGVTGQGVGIAVIGEPIRVDHKEYEARIRLYEDCEDAKTEQAMPWSTMLVSSIAGESTGVAPGVDLYYMATVWGGFDDSGSYLQDLTYAAGAIRRLLAINESLPADRKIRAIVVLKSAKFGNVYMGSFQDAVDDARAAGMLVIETISQGGDGRPLLGSSEGIVFEGLGRNPLDDPENFESYTYWEDLDRARYQPEKYFGANQIFFPSDSWTLANPYGGYTFVRQGITWQNGTGAYIAGAYALAAQVDPSITPARFFELVRQTGRSWPVIYKGTTYTLGPVLDLPALIAALKK
jgi:subtilisin family serine protease